MGTHEELLIKRMKVAISAKSAIVRAGQYEQGAAFHIRRIDAGKLALPTGRICVSDAYSADKYPALNRIVPNGEYSVELVIAELPKNLPLGDDRCAFAMVIFSDDVIYSWEPVTAVNAANPCFTDAKPNGIVQEGATGLFSPEGGAVHFTRLQEQFDEQVKTIRQQSSQFGGNSWINYRPGQEGANVVICEGGMGDGDLECFVGLSKVGRVARLVVDFGIADPRSKGTRPRKKGRRS